MKAKLMYKTIINGLASQRLCEIFKNVNEVHDYNLRGSSTKLHNQKQSSSKKYATKLHNQKQSSSKKYATRVQYVL